SSSNSSRRLPLYRKRSECVWVRCCVASDWVPRQLSDLIDIRHGFAFKGEHFRETPTPDVLLTPGNFAIGGGFQFNNVKYYDGPVPEEFVLEPGELLVAMTDLSRDGNLLGYPAIVPGAQGLRYLH